MQYLVGILLSLGTIVLAAVVGFAQVNALGNAAAFLTATSIGVIREATGSFQLALLPLMSIAALGCVGLAIMARRDAHHGRLIARAAIE